MWILPKDTVVVAKKLKNVKSGEWFTLKPIEEPKANQVWIKAHYVRSEKKYSCYNFDDINKERFFKSDKIVYCEFYF